MCINPLSMEYTIFHPTHHSFVLASLRRSPNYAPTENWKRVMTFFFFPKFPQEKIQWNEFTAILQSFRNMLHKNWLPYFIWQLATLLTRTNSHTVKLLAFTLAVRGYRRLLHKSTAAKVLLYAGNGFLRAHRHASRLTPSSLHAEVLQPTGSD